jgi:hypothetical protein
MRSVAWSRFTPWPTALPTGTPSPTGRTGDRTTSARPTADVSPMLWQACSYQSISFASCTWRQPSRSQRGRYCGGRGPYRDAGPCAGRRCGALSVVRITRPCSVPALHVWALVRAVHVIAIAHEVSHRFVEFWNAATITIHNDTQALGPAPDRQIGIKCGMPVAGGLYQKYEAVIILVLDCLQASQNSSPINLFASHRLPPFRSECLHSQRCRYKLLILPHN